MKVKLQTVLLGTECYANVPESGQHSKIPNRLTRTKSANNLAMNMSVVAISRPLMTFVGRLHVNMMTQNLTDWLAESGIHGAQCQKLVAKNGCLYKTAAFRVDCDNEYASLFYDFYDESIWPEGCELHDWVFKKNINGYANLSSS